MELLKKLQAELHEAKVQWAQVKGSSKEFQELKAKVEFLAQRIEFLKLAL